MKYFITGATGFIGGRVTAMLVEEGHEVIALARNPQRATKLRDIGAQVAQGDITDQESMREPMTGVDGLFHIAGWFKLGVRDKTPGQRINVAGTRHVLELMRELAIPKGVYTSTLAVNSNTGGRRVDESYRFSGKHLSEYDRTKWAAHYEVVEPMVAAGLPLVTVMPGLVYGPGDEGPPGAALRQYLRGRLPAAPQRTAYCWGHVDDVARGHILAMEKGEPGESYIIAGPCHTFIEALELAEKITGRRAPRLRTPPALMRTLASITGVLEKVLPLPPQYSAEYLRSNAGGTYLGDNSKAKRELGYDPRPLEAGLRQTLLYEMQQMGMKIPEPMA